MNPPHLAPTVTVARPSPVEKHSSGTRNTRQTNKMAPSVKKAMHVKSNSNKSPSVSSLPKSQKVPKSSQSVSVQPNVRRERQTPSNNKYSAPVNAYSTAPLEALPSTVDVRRIPTPKQSYKSTRARRPIAITRYVYNSPTGEEKEGDNVFNYAYETENGIKQR